MPNTRHKQKQRDESVHHFSHKHELFFYYYIDDHDRTPLCVVCRSYISTNEEYLSCERCTFHMHKSCAELPRKLKHPFHQQHSLTLLDEPPRRKGVTYIVCCACEKWCFDFVYGCSECEFYIDTKCAMLFPTTRLPAKHRKLLHPHPLIVCERKIVDCNTLDFPCGGCFHSFDYSTLIYVCLECRVLLHESCADLPQNITQHPLHPDCTLTFRIRSIAHGLCDFCQQPNSRLYFKCSDCSIKMDIPCALLTPCTTTNYKPVGEQKDNGHSHPLIHCNIHVTHYGFRYCVGCNQRLEKSAYYCVSCKMFLNKSCAELPHVIQHPFHPQHPLILSYLPLYFPCSACLFAYDSLFYYGCNLCGFYLHLRCASPIVYPMIYMSELHQHPLAYYDNIDYQSKCSKCTQNIHAGFRCLRCKFYVHDHCLPLLPPTVKTKWHRHPLTLTHAPIKGDSDEGDRDEGDPDEGDRDEGDRNEGEKVSFYCDCCEGKRDLKDPTYYCAKCQLVSHVGCVMWEVMDYLQGKSTKVGELCNTKVIEIGEAKAIDNIDHQDIMDEDSDHILTGLRNEIAAVSAELEERKAKLEQSSLKLKRLEERLSERLSQCFAYKTVFK